MLLHWFQRPLDYLLLLATGAAHDFVVVMCNVLRILDWRLILAAPAFRRCTHTHKHRIYVAIRLAANPFEWISKWIQIPHLKCARVD